MHVEIDRRDRPARRSRRSQRRPAARARRRARGGRRLARRCASALPRSSPSSSAAAAAGRAPTMRREARRSCAGSPTTTSPSSATASTCSSREAGEDLAARSTGTGLGHPARAPRRGRWPRPALPAELRDAARASRELLIITKANARSTVHRPMLPRLHRRQALRRRRARHRRAALPRPLHLRAPTTPSPREIPLLRHKVERVHRARRLRARAATTARRWRTSSRPTRATSCSRSPRTTCSAPRSASCTCRSASASRCSCAATLSTASSRCLVYVPRDRYNTESARAHRRRSCARRSAAGDRVLRSQLDASRRWRACTSSCAPRRAQPARASTPARAASVDLGSTEAVRALGRPAARRADRGATARSAARRCPSAIGEAFPAGYRERLRRRAPPSHDIAQHRRRSPSPTRPARCASTGRPTAPADALRLKLYPPASRSCLVRRAADAREHGRSGPRASSPYAVSDAPTATAVWIHDFDAIQHAVAQDLDLEVASRAFHETFAAVWRGQRRERRLQPPGARAPA